MARSLVFLLVISSFLFADDPSAISRVMTSTCQLNPNNPCSGLITVQATSADAFVDTQGVLWDPQSSYYGVLKVNTLNAGFRHVRSGAISATYVNNVKDLAAAGIKTQIVVSTNATFSVDPVSFWSTFGQSTSLLTFLTANFGSGISSIIDAIEGPNELDVEWPNTYWHPSDYPGKNLATLSSSNLWLGAYGVAYQKALYTAVKGNSSTANIKVIGPSVGYNFPSPFAAGVNGTGSDLQGYADWGGCHPYATSGNGNGVSQTTYDGSSFYYAYTIAPAQEVDVAPFAWDQCNSSTSDGKGTVYGTTPLAPSEQGFYTGSSKGAVSEDIQARYYPRIYAEMYRHGMPRTITYRFDDNCGDPTDAQCNWGLQRKDFTLKPAYRAMKSLNGLLQEAGASFKPGSLTYSVSVSPNGAFTRTQYMHDLLLEKSNGDFYLLFWHEIADAAVKNNDGSPVSGPANVLTPLPLPVTFTFPSTITSATVYTYDGGYNLQPSILTMTGNQVTVSATDKISVLRLSSNSARTRTSLAGAFGLTGQGVVN